MTSASPPRMARNASPMAMAPDAQLIPLVMLGPVMPSSMARLQLEAPTNTVRASPGSTQRIPPARNFSCSRSANSTPPSALPIIAPIRSGSSPARPIPASASARRPRSQSVGSKPSTSAPTWLRNWPGSKRVTRRVTDLAARRPSQKAPTPMPIGVTGPTPLITTRRSLMLRLRHPRYARERPPRDAVHEHRPDDPFRRRAANERPGGPRPLVDDGGAGARASPLHRPDHVHPGGDALDVAVEHLAPGGEDPHLRHPPGGPLERSEGAPGGHLHHASSAGSALVHPHPTIVGQEMGPELHLAGQAEDLVGGRRHIKSTHRAHHDAGRQTATSRAPGRRLTGASSPAVRSRRPSDSTLKPRRPEVSPPRTVVGSKRSTRPG